MVGRGAQIRTGDLRYPKPTRYQAALRPAALPVSQCALGDKVVHVVDVLFRATRLIWRVLKRRVDHLSARTNAQLARQTAIDFQNRPNIPYR